jgi:hypothetical protein
MNFEEVRVIWNTQDQQPLFAVNETVVCQRLLRERHRLRRVWFRWNIMTAYLAAGSWGVVIAVFLLFAMLTLRTAALFIASGIVMLYFLVTIVRDRQEEKRRETAPSGSLREELERGIANLDSQIQTGGGSSANKKAIPLIVSVLLASLGMREIMGSSWWLPAFVAGSLFLGFPLELLRHHRRVKRDLLPRKQTLESLRGELDRIDEKR